jgi:hypothetical protein
VKKLYLNSEQEQAIRQIYTENREYRMRFTTTAPSQTSAEQILHTNGLSQDGQPKNKLENCWLTAWSSTWGSKKGMKKRSLFQWYDLLFSPGVRRLNTEALQTAHPVTTLQRDKPEISAGPRTRLSGRGRPITSSLGASHTQT